MNIMELHNSRNFIAHFELDPAGGQPKQVLCRKCGAALPASANTTAVLAAGGKQSINRKIEIRCTCGAVRILHPGR